MVASFTTVSFSRHEFVQPRRLRGASLPERARIVLFLFDDGADVTRTPLLELEPVA